MLPIDASMLCDLVEYLCGSIVLVRANGAFHNVDLPLSWLRVLFPKLEPDPKLKRADIDQTLVKLVRTLAQFVDLLHVGAENKTSEFWAGIFKDIRYKSLINRQSLGKRLKFGQS